MRAPLALAFFVMANAMPCVAQTAREALVQGHEAYDFAEFDRAIPLLSAGLDRASGAPASLWTSGVHKLAHALIELNRGSVAGVWLRWALRLEPDLVVDDVDFPPPVVAAFAQARTYVAGSTFDPAVVRPTWEWPASPRGGGLGAVLIRAGAVTVSGRIEGGDFLSAGTPRSLPPGSYTIVATAENYLPARVTVEVLPGVTTQLVFTLAPVAAGFLYVAARPWGLVYVDGLPIGYSPVAAHRLTVGQHRVRIELPGHPPHDTTITVGHNQRLRLGLLTAGPPPTAAARPQGTFEQRLERALAALDSAETERGAQLLRELLASTTREIAGAGRVRPYAHLAAATFALGLRDSAAAQFAEMVRLNPFAGPDRTIFNPNLQTLYRSVRMSTSAVGLRLPLDTTLKPSTDMLLMTLAVGAPSDVTLQLRSLGAPARDTTLAVARVDSVGTLPLSLMGRDSSVLEPGDYELVASVTTPARATTATQTFRLTRLPVDTAPHELSLSSALFRPESRKGPPAISSAVRGLLFGAAVAAIPLALANKELDNPMLDHAAPVGASVLVAGVAGIFLGRKAVPIAESIEHNRALRASWEQRNRTIAAANERRRRFAPIRLQVLPEP